MRRRISKGDIETREKVVAAFKDLRKDGFIARANFMCCGSCAGYDLAEKATEMVDKGKHPKGCIFWHKQDEESYWAGGFLHLRYGEFNTAKHGTIGLPSEAVGSALIEALEKQGLKRGLDIEWDGDTNKTIIVKSRSITRVERETRETEIREARSEAVASVLC